MSIRIHKLLVTGQKKEDATLDFNGESHLVFGPTDTGKTYIVECLKYCMGSDDRPRDVGYSEGYTLAALQVSAQNKQFTLFRDLLQGQEAIYEGFHKNQPKNKELLSSNVGELLSTWTGAAGKKILTKSGTLGNFAPADLRHVSLFDEIETLNKVSLEGRDPLFKMRNRSAIAFIMTGVDDVDVVLVPSTDQRRIAKGHVEAIEEEMRTLSERISRYFKSEVSIKEAKDSLDNVNAQIGRIDSYLKTHSKELAALKAAHTTIVNKRREVEQRLVSLKEAGGRFSLLDSKYESDLQRLQSLSAAADVVATFEIRPCPLCKTDLSHKKAHIADEQSALRSGATAEAEKVIALRIGLKKALSEVEEDIQEAEAILIQLRNEENANVNAQNALVQPITSTTSSTLTQLTERKSVLSMAVQDLERIEQLKNRLTVMQARTKRKKQSVERDISSSATTLCSLVTDLLKTWGVPDLQSVSFDPAKADLKINNRERISYGKGKRGIFLTAYVIALMEHALRIGSPHLGVVAIDSPVVTYKDPKHGSNDIEEVLPVAVKDQFYAWLAKRKEPGQIIVIENEEPPEELRDQLPFTEFVGKGAVSGREGFFPV